MGVYVPDDKGIDVFRFGLEIFFIMNCQIAIFSQFLMDFYVEMDKAYQNHKNQYDIDYEIKDRHYKELIKEEAKLG